jgi:hypothetical protein
MQDAPEKPTVVYISNPDDEDRVIKIAKEIAEKTGGTIIIKRSDGSVIETICLTRQ